MKKTKMMVLNVVTVVIALVIITVYAFVHYLKKKQEFDSIHPLQIIGEHIKESSQNEVNSDFKIDLKKFPANRGKKIVFKLVNRGGKPLKITGVKSFCSCSVLKISNYDIDSKLDATASLEVLPNSLGGKFSKMIYISTNSKKFPLLRVRYFGVAEQLFDVKFGRTFYANIFKKNSVTEHRFAVESRLSLKEIFVEVKERKMPLNDVLKDDKLLWSLLEGNLKEYSIISVEDITENSFVIVLSVQVKEAKKGKAKTLIKFNVLEPKDNPPLTLSIVGRVY
ncbi:DUF1573 domain-containing protein [Lentisphaerota bacterium WC36G]|nr:DUF1573 domain-containing protein [Lentisphaerae bacterium WC36]